MYYDQNMDEAEITTESLEIRARLDAIYEQIKTYPAPIAGCDEQFNFLLAERMKLREMLEQL